MATSQPSPVSVFRILDGGAVRLLPGLDGLPELAAAIALQRLSPLLHFGREGFVSLAEIIPVQVNQTAVAEILTAIPATLRGIEGEPGKKSFAISPRSMSASARASSCPVC